MVNVRSAIRMIVLLLFVQKGFAKDVPQFELSRLLDPAGLETLKLECPDGPYCWVELAQGPTVEKKRLDRAVGERFLVELAEGANKGTSETQKTGRFAVIAWSFHTGTVSGAGSIWNREDILHLPTARKMPFEAVLKLEEKLYRVLGKL